MDRSAEPDWLLLPDFRPNGEKSGIYVTFGEFRPGYPTNLGGPSISVD